MHKLKKVFCCLQNYLDRSLCLDFLAPLAFRLYLAPVFWFAGIEKWHHMDNTIRWFANPEWGLGLPMPTLMAYLATVTELVGAVLLVIGLGVRWISIPLMAVMVVAALLVHIDNGWLAIADNSHEASVRLQGFLDWLQSHYPKRHAYVTELAKPVMLNNGIEFAVTYFIMLLSLFFTGAGRYLSLDYYIAKAFKETR